MTAPDALAGLIERFDSHREMYRSGRYNETMLRRDFLDPLFRALGWDVDNKKGYAEAYREVVHEDAIKVGGSTKAPDYCFRVGGGQRSFFVEAKKPSVDIRQDVGPAFQLRRYAWSAKLPVSILTDFEEFAVYDCRIRPVKTDKASTARVMYLKYTEYADRWEELVGLFSPDAIRRGLLDKFVASKRIKKGTAEVDTAFLEEIESWRTVLARNIALRNKNISQRDLNFAVQRTIDRMIFLRICEDRGIEQYGRLQSLQNGTKVYCRLGEMFQRADERYNSGLFHFTPEKDRPEPPDELTLALAIDDKPLKDIVRNLYFPDSPYEFAVLPAEILGQVYEQFLGKVIRLTKGHQAKVEEKPEVRKAGGVYYTPAYIVDYIVRHTVEKLLEGEKVGGRRRAVGGNTRLAAAGTAASADDTPSRLAAAGTAACDDAPNTRLAAAGTAAKSSAKKGGKRMTPKQAAKLKILDPACGSGSFLIGAYQFLLDWHRDWYTADDAEKHARGRTPKLYRDRSGQWRLTTTEKKRILLNNIYGVDIDPQAVEVTKLSLLLKVLEGESQETLSNQLRLFHERALPDLAGNIKCGNSLIGPDFYDGKQMDLFGEEEVYRINAFDWPAEFPEIFSPRPRSGRGAGGEGKNPGFDAVIGNPPYGAIFGEDEVQYLLGKFDPFQKTPDAYVAFLEQAHALLLKRGKFGFIIPSAWLGGPSYKKLREFVLGSQIDSVVLLPFDVFKDAYIDTVLLTTTKHSSEDEHKVCAYEFPKKAKISKIDISALPVSLIDQRDWYTIEDKKFVVNLGILKVLSSIRDKTKQKLVDLVEMKRGVLFDKNLLTNEKVNEDSYRYFEGDVYRYKINFVANHWIEYGPKMREYPKEFRWFEGERLVLRRLVNRQQRLMTSIISETVITNKNLYTMKTIGDESIHYVLGILNSRLISRLYLSQVSQARKDDFPQVTIRDALSLPMPNLKLCKQSDKTRHDRMVELVENMLSLHKRLSSAQTPHEKTLLQRQIDATDRQIDRLVYELYELTDEEIAIVEGS